VKQQRFEIAVEKLDHDLAVLARSAGAHDQRNVGMCVCAGTRRRRRFVSYGESEKETPTPTPVAVAIVRHDLNLVEVGLPLLPVEPSLSCAESARVSEMVG
jgi:hypothetical protein